METAGMARGRSPLQAPWASRAAAPPTAAPCQVSASSHMTSQARWSR